MKARRPQGDNYLGINVKNKERIASAVAGGYFLYNAITQRDKLSIPNAIGAGYLLFRAATGYCPVYHAIGKSKLPNPSKTINIRTKLIVNRPRIEVFNFWRKLENLPLFMTHLESVEKIDEKYSKWKANFPGSSLVPLEWKAEIVKERYGEFIGWSSTNDASITNAGKVEFKDAMNKKGTEIDVVISYHPPLGAVGSGLSKLFNKKLSKLVQKDIKNFKTYIETGVNEKREATV